MTGPLTEEQFEALGDLIAAMVIYGPTSHRNPKFVDNRLKASIEAARRALVSDRGEGE
jgi:hypothetical protein